MRLILALLTATLPCVLSAAERRETITDFDRIRVEGAFDVAVTTGRGTSLVMSGPTAAIDATTVAVSGRTLVIRRQTTGWSNDRNAGTVMIRVTTPLLTDATLLGSGRLRVDRMRGQRVAIGLAGSGSVDVGQLTADRADIVSQGSGRLSAGGTVANASLSTSGSGEIDLANLAVADLRVTATGSGTVDGAARRSARITANGSGTVKVAGSPACTVTNSGSGTVSCGSEKAERR